MNVLAENGGKIYGAMAIDLPSDFVNPFPSTLFPCLIWDHDGRFSDAQRAAVAKALLQAGCRYAVCGGQNCSAWHDAVDREFVGQHQDDSDEGESAFVMTSWHADENPDEVAFFFVLNTNFDDHYFEHFLVLHVGDSRVKEEVNAAVRRYALDEKAV